MGWQEGDSIAYRHLRNGRVTSARPVTVLADSDVVALYLAVGSTFAWWAFESRSMETLLTNDWEMREQTWRDNHVLILLRAGEPYSPQLFVSESGARRWYLNLQEPYWRSAVGFDTTDHVLDLEVTADLTDWRLKDEDELEEAQRVGLIEAEKVDEIRSNAQRVIDLLASRNTWWAAWSDWSPPQLSSVPSLPPRWDRVTFQN
jgi:predicted RNA-binding protein associated with RNAse of E/G family